MLQMLKSETRDGMRIDWDAPIAMDDGVVLRADVFRPIAEGKYPVILSYGPYAKGLAFQEGYKGNWARLIKAAPEVLQGSSNKYQNWELVDPEKWVPDGYVCVRVDSRGAGRSPGFLDVWSPRETDDLYQCIEWAGTQPWSNGKVGINGISYYAMNQWTVGALKPPHLAALCIWEGSSDYYRELCRHGGILSDFLNSWHPRQVASVQHGVGSRGAKSVVTGEPVAGPDTLAEGELAKNCADSPGEAKRRRLTTTTTPRAPPNSNRSKRRCSRPPIGAAWGCTPAAISKVICAPAPNKNGWKCTATPTSRISTATTARRCRNASSAISSKARIPAGANSRVCRSTSAIRGKNSCCAARANGRSGARNGPNIICSRRTGADAARAGRAATLSYETTGDGLTFRTPPMTESLEITGPVAAKLFVSSPTTDADIFLALRAVRSRRQGDHLHRLQRSARAGRARLAARLAAQARSGALAAVSALAHP